MITQFCTVNQLLTMTEELGLEDEELDFCNLMEPTKSPFSELFLEQEKMKVHALALIWERNIFTRALTRIPNV